MIRGRQAGASIRRPKTSTGVGFEPPTTFGTPLSHRPKQIHPKQIPKQKWCRNRRPQANKTLKTTSPSTPLEKFIPKQKSVKSPSKHRKSYVPKHWLITPQANPKKTPRKPQGIRSDPVIKGVGYANRCA